jgi:toxic protein SymE
MAERNHKPRGRVGKSETRKSNRDFPYTRHLKVHPGQYYQSFDPVRVHRLKQPRPPGPWVHVKGYWLAEAGFEVGTPLQVEVSEGRLVISAASEPSGV